MFKVFSVETVHRLEPILHFAMGLMAVAVGGHLEWRRLRNAKKRLGMLLLLEITITPVLVFLVVIATDTDRYTAMLLATMAISSAPATILASSRRRGPMACS